MRVERTNWHEEAAPQLQSVWQVRLPYWGRDIQGKGTSSNPHRDSRLNIEWAGEFRDCAACRSQYVQRHGYTSRHSFRPRLLNTQHLSSTWGLRATATYVALDWDVSVQTCRNCSAFLHPVPSAEGTVLRQTLRRSLRGEYGAGHFFTSWTQIDN
jgi:hypothetical protein